MKKHKTTRQGTRRAQKAATLALAVSLWTAGGDVTSAAYNPAGSTQIKLNAMGTDVYWYNDDETDRANGKYGSAAVSGSKTLSVGGTWTKPDNTAGYYFIAGDAGMLGMQVNGYTMNINGATFSSDAKYAHFYGAHQITGSGAFNLTNNAVIITNSKFVGDASIYGADLYGGTGTIDGCSVTIAGTLGDDGKPLTVFSGGTQSVIAGYNGSAMANNTVNLYGAAAMENVGLSGAWYNANTGAPPSRANNALHLGGTKSGNPVNGIALSPWQGYDANGNITNTVKSVGYFNKIVLHQVKWDTNTPALKATTGFFDTNEHYTTGFSGTVDISDMTFVNAPTIGSTGTMTLLQGQGNNFKRIGLAYSGGTATLNSDHLRQIVKNGTMTALVTDGVTLDYNTIQTVFIEPPYSMVYYKIENSAPTRLAFGNVAWSSDAPLVDHSATLADVSFSGTNVDTSSINFTNLNVEKLKGVTGNRTMTLVSSFGDSVGEITGTTFKIGTTLQGKGKASLKGNDLIFTVATKPRPDGTPDDDPNGDPNGEPDIEPQPQTHNALMGAGAGMIALSAGNDFIGDATDGLAQAANIGADGVSAYAKMGGGSTRQETGSHIDVHGWNAILALGHKNEKERGTMEYGAFFEYGNGNYTTVNGDLRGDGSTHYIGGGLLSKWKAKSGIYVEGSLRAGSLHGETNGTLRDISGRPYNVEIDAPYFGFHLGVGRELTLGHGNTLDVYGKYFMNRRNSVSFDAGGQYDLDALTSQVLRIGARYTVKGAKWDFYAGAAYEHEFDGKATGTADGFAIRGADTSGGSFRGEIGATMTPGENSPWKLDLNVTGFAGKKQGITGGMSVSLMF